MLRAGIVDFDTSHSLAFTRLLNGEDGAGGDYEARMVLGCALPSDVDEENRAQRFIAGCKELGVEMVEHPDEMLGRIDAVFIESNDGRTHLRRAAPFIEAGVPTFVDKPFAATVQDARELARLAREYGTPLFSASSLRYAAEVQAFKEDPAAYGELLGALTTSPSVPQAGKNPGLIYYGIHGIEMLYEVMGTGCTWVQAVGGAGAEQVLGHWEDGRIATMRGITRPGARGFGLAIWGTEQNLVTSVDTSNLYDALMSRIVTFFKTGEAPVPLENSVEAIAFARAAVRSLEQDGARVTVAGVD